MKIMCKIFEHDWRYNFPVDSSPSKAICARCFLKVKWKGSISGLLQMWTEVNKFDNEKRSDKELINKWHKKNY